MSAVKKQSMILASGSPRRRELLSLLDLRVEIRPVAIKEARKENEASGIFVERLALEKAHAAISEKDGMILAADTIVVDQDQILGKPSNEAHAKQMLMDLRGRTHRVITAIALLDLEADRILTDLCETEVPMRPYALAEIEAYIASGDPMDKAGAYGIQNSDFSPVDIDRMQGCYANVMGLPLCHLARTLRRNEIMPPKAVPEKCRFHTGYQCTIYPRILGIEK